MRLTVVGTGYIHLVKRISKNKFIQNIARLASGTAVAQLITVIATPVLARVYTPETFGLLGGVLTVAGIVSSSATLKQEMAIVMSNSKKETDALLLLSFIPLVGVVLSIALLLSFFPHLLPYIGIDSTSKWIIAFVSLLILFMGLYNVVYQLHSKNENYGILARNSLLQKIAIVALQLVLAYSFSYQLGLIVGNVIGYAVSVAFLLLNLPFLINTISFSKSELFKTFKKYYHFSLYTTPQNLLNSISQGLPILLLAKYFGAAEVGFYFFAMRLIQLPASVVGGAIRQVFYKKAVDLVDDKASLWKEYKRTTLSLIAAIALPVVIVFMYGPEIFSLLFGAEWEIAGEYASWMFLWVGLLFINPPAISLYYVLKKQSIQLVFEVILLVLRVTALIYGGESGNMLLTVKLYSLVGLAFNVIFILYIVYSLKKWK